MSVQRAKFWFHGLPMVVEDLAAVISFHLLQVAEAKGCYSPDWLTALLTE